MSLLTLFEHLTEEEDPAIDRAGDAYYYSLRGMHSTGEDRHRYDMVKHWPPTAQEMREIERTLLQDPACLHHWAYHGWKSFQYIPEDRWEFDARRKLFYIKSVPSIFYIPKKIRGTKHPQGGQISATQSSMWVTLDGRFVRGPYYKKNSGDLGYLNRPLNVCVQQIRDLIARVAPKIKQNLKWASGRYYIRFGKWPENERSGIYGPGYDPNNQQYEQGVSVYNCHFDMQDERWDIEPDNEATMAGTMQSLIYSKRPVYLVQGDVLDETGADDEPLLRNVKLIKELDRMKDIYCSGVFDPRDDLADMTPREIDNFLSGRDIDYDGPDALKEMYTEPNNAFRRYMTVPVFDPYQHWYWVCKWVVDNDYLDHLAWAIKLKRGEDVVFNSADDLMEEEPDVFYLLPDDVQRECGSDVTDEVLQHDAASASTFNHADLANKKLLPRSTWLVHFSNNAPYIHDDGFTHGTADMSQLGLTTWFKNVSKKSGGYNFAFRALSKYARSAATMGKYGRHAVLFQNSGVAIHHHGDEEEQIVFWGKDVDPKNIILLIDGADGWKVMRRDGGSYGQRDYVFVGDYDTVVKWVMKNHQQYRNVL